MELTLKYDGKKIKVQEPTIEMWSNVMKFRDLLDEDELNIKMLAMATNLTEKEIMESDVNSMRLAADAVYRFMNQESKQLHTNIIHNNKKYTLVDVNKMSFGQFVDIDTFLQKDEGYRIANLNELATYLYTLEGQSYADKEFKEQIQEFRTLPIKYIEGSIFFLSTLGQASQELTHLYFKSKWMWVMMMTRLRLANIGGGISRYLRWPKTVFGKLTMLVISPLLLVSIILHILWMSINKLRSRLKS